MVFDDAWMFTGKGKAKEPIKKTPKEKIPERDKDEKSSGQSEKKGK